MTLKLVENADNKNEVDQLAAVIKIEWEENCNQVSSNINLASKN